MNVAMRVASGAVLSLALVSVPASARSYRGHHGGYHNRYHGGGIGTLGGILLGAAVLGTVAAIANDNRRDRYEPRYEPQSYGGNTGYRSYDDQYASNDPRAVPSPAYAYDEGDNYADEPNGYDRQSAAGNPVEECSRAAERQAQTGGGYARVTGIDRVDEIAGGANVRGRLQIDSGRAAPVRSLSFSCSASDGEVRNLRLG